MLAWGSNVLLGWSGTNHTTRATLEPDIRVLLRTLPAKMPHGPAVERVETFSTTEQIVWTPSQLSQVQKLLFHPQANCRYAYDSVCRPMVGRLERSSLIRARRPHQQSALQSEHVSSCSLQMPGCRDATTISTCSRQHVLISPSYARSSVDHVPSPSSRDYLCRPECATLDLFVVRPRGEADEQTYAWPTAMIGGVH